FDRDGRAVGVIMPTARNARTHGARLRGCINFLGVLPSMRGKGYVNNLLGRGTASLIQDDATRIVSSTDVLNYPMDAAFRRAGYVRRAVQRVWEATCAS